MDCVVTYQDARPISICSCCDRALADEAVATVVFRDGRIEDYCLACFDGTLLVRRR